MILYLDTSALIKLFRHEDHTDQMVSVANEATLVVTHAIAYVEACSAFARLARVA